jgi:hypothetical protein
MEGEAGMSAGRPEPLPSTPWPRRVRRLVLPVTAGAALLAGAALALGGLAAGSALAPAMLILFGVGALLAVVLADEGSDRPVRTHDVTTPPAAVPRAARPRSSTTRVPTLGGAPNLAGVVGNRLSDRGTAAAILPLAPASAADQLWSSWSSTAGELPVRLVGPVPETLYLPPREGLVDPFPEKAPDVILEDVAWRPVVLPPLANDVEEFPALSFPAELPSAMRSLSPVELEALNAMPPHRRGIPGALPRESYSVRFSALGTPLTVVDDFEEFSLPISEPPASRVAGPHPARSDPQPATTPAAVDHREVRPHELPRLLPSRGLGTRARPEPIRIASATRRADIPERTRPATTPLPPGTTRRAREPVWTEQTILTERQSSAAEHVSV